MSAQAPAKPPAGAPTIALVAGEASGDQLGAGLIEKLRSRYPQARFVGVGGHKMQAAGMEAWWDARDLAVMGLFEVLSHLPRLLEIRGGLKRRLLELRPEIYIGIDAPDFNLGLEIALRRAGIRTVQYVSPTVWAWRKRRVRKIARAADRVLCLFPFEPDFYRDHGVDAVFVGHPLADRITEDEDPAAARRSLGLDPKRRTVALLPGSRVSEVSRLAAPMLDAVKRLLAQEPGLQFVSAMANEDARGAFVEAAGEDTPPVTLVDHDPQAVIASADAVICASGTATLEVMLVNRPLVMCYILAAATYHTAKNLRLIRRQAFSLPNILAGEELITELIQQEVSGESLAAEVRRMLDDKAFRRRLQDRFGELHRLLRQDADARAADAVAELLDRV